MGEELISAHPPNQRGPSPAAHLDSVILLSSFRGTNSARERERIILT